MKQHTIERMKRRWNIELSEEEYDRLCARVVTTGVRVAKKYTGGQSCYLLAVSDQIVPVIVDRREKVITTVKTRQWRDQYMKNFQQTVYRRTRKPEPS